MSQDHHLLHKHLGTRKRRKAFDILVTCAAFMYPLSGIGQAIEVFQGNTAGVSLASWIGFACFASIFFIYGLTNRIRPMIISNGLWLVVDSLVVTGILYSTL